MNSHLLPERKSAVIISFILLSSLIGQPLSASPGKHERHHWNWTKISVTVTPSNPVLTCASPSTTIRASTSASGTTTYSWTGPNSFTATGSSITVSTAGTYTVTGTNAGKTGSATATVTSNTTHPPTMSPGNTGPLTCSSTSAMLVPPFGSDTGISVIWTGPNGWSSTDAFPAVSVPGTYALVVTYTATGCATSNPTTVEQDITVPAVAVTAAPATAQVTCTNPTIRLTGSSTTTGLTYSWSGPGVVSTSGASATVNLAGTYTVTVTNPTNGCISSLASSVTRNVSAPIGLTASPRDVISCFTPTIDLQGGSSTPGATFSWSGPGGYTATSAQAETSVPGNYTLTVTDPTNGCSASTGTTVLADTATPANVTASNNGPITCTTTSVTISSSSSTPGVDFTWVTPSSTFISGATAVVTVPGTYTIQVTNNGNGCVSQATTTVIKNCPGSAAATPGAVNGRTTEGFSGDPLTGFVYRTYPNPVSTTAFIEFASPVSSPVKVELYSSDGYREAMLFNNTANANQLYKLQLGTARLSSGTHFCVISSNGKVYTSKLFLIR